MRQKLWLCMLLIVMGLICVAPVWGQDEEKTIFNDSDLAYQEAQRRIEEARIWSKTELYLYDLYYLNVLPPEIGQLTYLKILQVQSWALDAIPPELFQLTNLEVLTFSNTLIPAIPSEIERLKNLRELKFFSEREAGLLTTLPPEIEQLKQLQSLWLFGNKFKVFPSQIFNLPQLAELSLFFNPLTEIPADIGMLTSLRYLDLSLIEIQSLPPEIGKLTLLETLNLGGNQALAELPTEISQLSNLKQLDITGTAITKLPIELGDLPQFVKFEANTLTFPSPDIVAQGTPAILAYLRDYEAMLMRQTIAGIAAGVGVLVSFMLLFRWRQRRGLSEKKKRA